MKIILIIANLKVSVLLLFTVSNGSRFQIGMVRGMKLILIQAVLVIFGIHLYVCKQEIKKP